MMLNWVWNFLYLLEELTESLLPVQLVMVWNLHFVAPGHVQCSELEVRILASTGQYWLVDLGQLVARALLQFQCSVKYKTHQTIYVNIT